MEKGIGMVAAVLKVGKNKREIKAKKGRSVNLAKDVKGHETYRHQSRWKIIKWVKPQKKEGCGITIRMWGRK